MLNKQFGNTWWGEQWLNSMRNEAWDKSLMKGAVYAGHGLVRDFTITNNLVEARVVGSKLANRSVSIKFLPYEKELRSRVLKLFDRDAGLVSQLLSRKLDPKLLFITNQLKLPIFPNGLEDIHVSCNCNSKRKACKHVAVALILLVKEIDGNPALIFSLRGLNVVEELNFSAKGLEMSLLGELLSPVADSVKNMQEGVSVNTEIDYQQVPDLSETLAQMLPKQPSFFSDDNFLQLYRSRMQRAKDEAGALLGRDNKKKNGYDDEFGSDEVNLFVDSSFRPAVRHGGRVVAFSELVGALASYDAGDVLGMSETMRALYKLHLTALNLLAKGSVVAHLFLNDEGQVNLLWLPAFAQLHVCNILLALSNATPENLLLIRRDGSEDRFSNLEQTIALVSLCINYYIFDGEVKINQKSSDAKIIRLFFGNGKADFSGAGENEITDSVQGWLACYQMQNQDLLPELVFTQDSVEEFSLSININARSIDAINSSPLDIFLQDPKWHQETHAILRTLTLVQSHIKRVNVYLKNSGKEPLVFSIDELPHLLNHALPAIRLLGIKVALPIHLSSLIKPKKTLLINATDRDNSLKGAWRIEIGDSFFSLKEFEKMTKKESGIIPIGDRYMYLDKAEINEMCQAIKTPPKLDGNQLLRIALAGQYQNAKVDLSQSARELLTQFHEHKNIPIPHGLTAQLRPYQVRGYEWMYQNYKTGFGSVIADDMGLGKTIQVISFLLKIKQEKELATNPALVIVPTSLLSNWLSECRRFAPSLKVHLRYGAVSKKKGKPHILLTSYGTVRSRQAEFQEKEWAVIVADEAQNFKNTQSKQTKAIKSLSGSCCIAMSGTPVENRLSEYWSIMDFVNKGYLGALPAFINEYANPIQVSGDVAVAKRFRKITAPFIMRRMKTDKSIISDIPKKITQDQFCIMTTSQKNLYHQVVKERLEQLQSPAKNRGGIILNMILSLKQICNHPAHYSGSSDVDINASGKTTRFLEILDEIYAGNEKTLIFTQYRKMGDILCNLIEERYHRPPLFFHGQVSRLGRDEIVSRFQSEHSRDRVLILTLKAGSSGLNLTAATQVIHYDLWWNPAVESQATDRAYRIGQDKPVHVHRLITKDSFEEKIDNLLSRKKQLADMTVSTGEQWLGNLGDEELKMLFS